MKAPFRLVVDYLAHINWLKFSCHFWIDSLVCHSVSFNSVSICSQAQLLRQEQPRLFLFHSWALAFTF